ncbi:hypothetical protein [Parapedobacter pyrenivorans]|uniref:hypothetical protein n=1 Tax=Parapedobacter pyrenivorans TaxID=1305674 RepID=UPI003342B467
MRIHQIKKYMLLLAGMISFLAVGAQEIHFSTIYFRLTIDSKGFIVSLYDNLNRKEYTPRDFSAPLLTIRSNGQYINPTGITQSGNILRVAFGKNGMADIQAETRTDYIRFELQAIDYPQEIDLVVWGPFPTIIDESIGENVGVVKNQQFAIGIQALNAKTLGGYPSEESDIEPSFDIFQTGSLADISEETKTKKQYRGQTAKVTDFGSILQAYTRNRAKTREISNWDHTNYIAPSYEDGGVLGSTIALFGCPQENALETIGKIELAEGLPHPLIDGVWAKISPQATASYLIMNFNGDNLDDAIKLTKKAGLRYLYHGDPFETWGHFRLKESAFPQQHKSLKNYVSQAEAQGVDLGIHTLSGFITTNDSYVTPVPDRRLAKVGQSMLTSEITADAEEIPIESPLFFNQMKNNTLKAVVIGDEIIRYQTVSTQAPWKLIGCVRGAYGTQSVTHKKGTTIGKLMDHPYKVFLPDAALADEIATNLADLFNETGLKQISFDGLEGVWSTGMGQYARALFTKAWYDNLNPTAKENIINDASNPSHFNWHINTRYNWGEPWYAGFRESQTQYRLMNQDFYRRNLLPAMLGWFSMSPQTSIEDTEWLLARAAGFDAGFAFNVNFDAVIANGQADTIFHAIKHWESARMAGAFTAAQKLRMMDIHNEFHLQPLSPGKWLLYPYAIQRHEYLRKIRQPGEPVNSEFEFKNPFEAQVPIIIVNFIPDPNGGDAVIEELSIAVSNHDAVKIPVKMAPFQRLKLINEKQVQVFDRNWKLLETVNLSRPFPKVASGMNNLSIDAVFTGEGLPKLHLEIKTAGKGEDVTAHK